MDIRLTQHIPVCPDLNAAAPAVHACRRGDDVRLPLRWRREAALQLRRGKLQGLGQRTGQQRLTPQAARRQRLPAAAGAGRSEGEGAAWRGLGVWCAGSSAAASILSCETTRWVAAVHPVLVQLMRPL